MMGALPWFCLWVARRVFIVLYPCQVRCTSVQIEWFLVLSKVLCSHNPESVAALRGYAYACVQHHFSMRFVYKY